MKHHYVQLDERGWKIELPERRVAVEDRREGQRSTATQTIIEEARRMLDVADERAEFQAQADVKATGYDRLRLALDEVGE